MEKKEQDNKKTILGKGFLPRGIGKEQLLIMLLVGILLLVIVFPTKDSNKMSEKEKNTEEAVESKSSSLVSADQLDAYVNKKEEQLEKMLACVEGVGRVQVMITLKGTKESVVEKDSPQAQSKITESDSSGGTRETSENSWEETTVYIQGTDGSTVPYVSKELEPEVEGVLVIAEGGGNASVTKNICEAVQALFSIEIHKIKVMKMKS